MSRICFLALTLLPGANAARLQSNHWFGEACPAGLVESGTKEKTLCAYEYSTPGGSDEPLIFTAEEGKFKFQAQLLAELAATMKNGQFVGKIVTDCDATQKRERGEEKEAEEEESAWERFEEEFEKSEETLMPLHFLAEHLGEHAAIELVVEGASVVAEASEAAALDAAVHSMALEGLASGALGLEIAGDALLTGLALPVVVVPQVLYMLYKFNRQHEFRGAHARAYVRKLVMNSDCVQSKLNNPEFMLKDKVSEICGVKSRGMLRAEMLKSNDAMMKVFKTLADVGHCTYPHGKRAWSKLNCAEKLYPKMYEHGRKPGLIDEIFAFAGTYANEVDKLVKEPVYGTWFDHVLGIDTDHLPRAAEEKSAEELAKKNSTEKITSCVSTIATHKAFGALFNRIAKALPIFTGTFARRVSQVSLLTSSHPCRRVFHAVDLKGAKEQEASRGYRDWSKESDPTWKEDPTAEPEKDDDDDDDDDVDSLCKHYDFKDGYGKNEHLIDESDACSFNVTAFELGE